MKYEGIRVIGLTGGIACGKSSIANFFVHLGIPVIDADMLARDAVAPGTVSLDQVVALFGKSVLTADGLLNRASVRQIVFSDTEKRRQLESILHPEIKRLARLHIAKAIKAGDKYLIYMAPLLIEAGALDRVDELWVVTLRPEIQLQRLMKRDNLTAVEAQRIISSQMSLAEKERYATVIIHNDGTLQETMRDVELIWNRELEKNYES